MPLSMNLGKDADGTMFLILADLDTNETYPLAQFFSEDHATAFTKYMETQGYVSLNLPTQAEIDAMLDEQ